MDRATAGVTPCRTAVAEETEAEEEMEEMEGVKVGGVGMLMRAEFDGKGWRPRRTAVGAGEAGTATGVVTWDMDTSTGAAAAAAATTASADRVPA